jgi:hypothetical protein
MNDRRPAGALAVVVAVLVAAGCGAGSPVSSSRPVATPAPPASPAPVPFVGIMRMIVTIDPECAGSFPSSRRDREYLVSVPPDSNGDSEVLPSILDADIASGSGTILGGGYRPIMRLRYQSAGATVELDFVESVSNHELMRFLGTASFSPFLPLPSCARFDGNVYLTNTALSLDYVCASRNHQICLRNPE